MNERISKIALLACAASVASMTAQMAAQSVDRLTAHSVSVKQVTFKGRSAVQIVIVNDLKHEPQAGGVALWVGPGTEGYFSNLTISGSK